MAGPLPVGTRVRLVAMVDDPYPVPVGTLGTVRGGADGSFPQIWVKWDNGSSLALLPGVDEWEVVDDGPATT